ncbi:MAG: DUF4860 domain-containing protein [Clostridia bacterium]|nr:DUF4860 domain-containing protein [Clostridia bacterium]
MKVRIQKLKIARVFPTLCFAMLAACIVIVLITGAELYSRSNTRDTEDYYHRTVTSYVATRVSQSAVEGCFFVGDFNEAVPAETGDTFFFTETFDGITYVTRLYCHDGALYELFSPMSAELDRSAGERVLSLNDMTFAIKGGLFTAEITFDDGKTETVRLSLRTEESKR